MKTPNGMVAWFKSSVGVPIVMLLKTIFGFIRNAKAKFNLLNRCMIFQQTVLLLEIAADLNLKIELPSRNQSFML